MKVLNKIAFSLTAFVSASTIICGCSIASKAVVEASSVSFHTGLGVLTVLLSFATIALFSRSAKQNKA